jgi:hypothetical protein
VAVGSDVALHEVRVPLVVNVVTPEEAAGADPDHAVVEEVLILTSARLRDEARRLAEQGDTDAGVALLSETAKSLRDRATGSAWAVELLAEAESLDQSVGWLHDLDASGSLSARSRKLMHYESLKARRRRHPGDGPPKGA